MKKKFSIILVFLFIVSTIGLPLSINFCSMMDTPQAGVCEMHSNDRACETENHHILLKTELTRQDCCKTEIIDKAISDNYLQTDIQIHNLNQNIIAVINPNLAENNNSFVNLTYYFSDISPPSLSNNHIYLSISILLI